MAHLTRYRMYKRIRECLEENNCLPIRGKILGISGIKNFYSLIDMKNTELVETEYPQVDMQNLPFKDNSFDFVISDQVIEHLKDPQKATRETYRILKKGGIAIHTTCFLIYLHPSPKDFWRFSSEALKLLCRDFSKILQCESWGNRIAILFCFLSDRFRLLSIPDRKWSIRRLIANYNEKKYPMVTWIVVKK